MGAARMLAAVVLLTGLLAPQARAETIYWRSAGERITVVSNGSARRCTRIAAQFVSFERVLRALAGLDEDSQLLPLTVYALSESDADQVFLTAADRQKQDARRMHIYSKYLPGIDRNMAVVVEVDGNGIDEPVQSVLLLYAESLMTGGPMRAYPLWYQIGVANLTNGLLIREDGSVLLNREGPFEPDVGKDVRVKYDLATLLGSTRGDLANGGDWRAYSRRAREFAQYGLLTGAERRAQYRELATLMRQGTPADQAVQQAFGRALAEVARELDDGRWHRDAQYKIAAPAGVPPLPAPAQLDPVTAREALQLVADRVARFGPRP
jgi:hypothetical protein